MSQDFLIDAAEASLKSKLWHTQSYDTIKSVLYFIHLSRTLANQNYVRFHKEIAA